MPLLPSATSSSTAPFTWEKHHWMSFPPPAPKKHNQKKWDPPTARERAHNSHQLKISDNIVHAYFLSKAVGTITNCPSPPFSFTDIVFVISGLPAFNAMFVKTSASRSSKSDKSLQHQKLAGLKTLTAHLKWECRNILLHTKLPPTLEVRTLYKHNLNRNYQKKLYIFWKIQSFVQYKPSTLFISSFYKNIELNLHTKG